MDTTYSHHGVSTKGVTGVIRDTDETSAWQYLVPLGRALFALIFIMSGFGHFSSQVVGYAASQGVPLPGLLVPLSGLMAIVGGLSVLLGYRTRIGALILLAFLVPVTFMMHNFWAVPDAMQAANQQAHFMKNIALIGGALFIAFFGAGPKSIDARRSYIA
jgi:putative oxidoreductase